MTYIRITTTCTGIERNRYDGAISKWIFYKDEIFESVRVYNYYAKDNHNWNTEHPIATLEFEDSPTFKLEYEIPPDCYQYIDEPEHFEDITRFREYDLVEREESLVANVLEVEQAVDFILDEYIMMSRIRLNEYKWKKDEDM